MRHLCTVVVAVLTIAQTARAQSEDLAGAVVAIGEVPGDAATEGALEAGGARWHAAGLTAEAAPAAPAPDAEVAALYARWANADFGGCLSAAQSDALDPTELLVLGHRDTAAAVLTYSAGCALGAGDRARASELLSRALVADLNIVPWVAGMTTELQRLAERLLQEQRRVARVPLQIETRPASARITIDGRECGARPCRAEVAPGEHVVVARRLGYFSRVQSLLVTGPTERRLALDPGTPGLQLRQLREALFRGVSPSELSFMRAASSALGAPLVVSVWQSADRYQLALFDRREGTDGERVLVGAADVDRDALRRASRALIEEWRDLQPRSVLRSPWFWISAALIVGAAATTAYLLSREPDRNYVLVGR